MQEDVSRLVGIDGLVVTAVSEIGRRLELEVRPFYLPPRTFQRTVYRPGEICQFDLWQPSREVPVGHGQTRAGYVVLAALGYSRVGAGALIFSKEAVDILWGVARCLRSFGAVPKTLADDVTAMIAAPASSPEPDRRWVTRVPVDP